MPLFLTALAVVAVFRIASADRRRPTPWSLLCVALCVGAETGLELPSPAIAPAIGVAATLAIMWFMPRSANY